MRPNFWLYLAISQKLLNQSWSNFQHLMSRYSGVGTANFIVIRQGRGFRFLPPHPACLFGEIRYWNLVHYWFCPWSLQQFTLTPWSQNRQTTHGIFLAQAIKGNVTHGNKNDGIMVKGQKQIRYNQTCLKHPRPIDVLFTHMDVHFHVAFTFH